MQAIFDFIYLIAFVSYLLLSIFIIYHVVRYTSDKAVTTVTLLFFITGTVLLLFANAVFFFAIPFDQLIPVFPLPSSSPMALPW